ncbi:MAG: amino acid ABC transporter substrate-binding protein [Candidatus Lambdaproteobacteria bacterium]|nr:amino acid ABC transporter substrate-binding protein [Candidatus Lambdaproteobacteria bacterium]
MKQHIWGMLTVLLGATLPFSGSTVLADHRSGNVVLVGGAISQTGRYAEPAGRQYNSVKLWVDQVNQRGGLLGHKVLLTMLDDKSDTQTAIKLYEKLITEDKVDLLVGPYSSGITDAVANVTERYHMPIVAYGAASADIWERGRKYIFAVNDIAENYQKGAAHLAKQIGVKRIAIIGEDSLFPRMSRKGLEQWAKQLGLQVVVAENYATQKQGDYTALLQKIKAQRVEAIFSNSYFDDAAAQIRQLREMNYDVKFFASTVGPGLPRFAKDLGPTAEYVLGFSQWEPNLSLGHPGMKEFIDAYKARYGTEPNYHSASAYASMQVFEAAVKQAGSFDREKLRDALSTIQVRTMFGTYKVDEKGMTNHEGLTFQIRNGKRMIVWPPHLAEVKPILPVPKWSER